MSQQLVMTPQLQQAIKLLQLSHMELESLIQNELQENPLLEDPTTSTVEADSAELKDERSSIDNFEAAQAEPNLVAENQTAEVRADGTNEIDWENYLNNYQLAPPTTSNKGLSEDLPSFVNNLTRSVSLYDHLHEQMRLADFTDEEQRVAEYILGNLDDAGYFRIDGSEGDPLIVAASESGVSIAVADAALRKLQRFDPLGVCARDLQECLLIQARAWGEENTLVGEIVRKHLKLLEARNLKGICKAAGCEQDDAVEAIKTIAEMEPKPGRHFVEDDAQYITPDVYVHMVGDEYVVVVNDDGLSKLRISQHYKDTLRSGEAKSNGSKEFIQEKLRSAVWLIRSIHQRQRTIHKVTESIVKFQRDFLDHGIAHLKPLILKDVAEDIEMHESTVSRVTTNKYVHTPRGIFELKFFFNSAIAKTGGDDIASEAVKEEIKKLVAAEDTARPFSDQKLVDLLRDRNIEIARRTVAKYREVLGILPSSKRRKLY
jgi:RNA polymerase sigma-54 factor